MSMAPPVAHMRTAGNLRQADAALDGVLLKQTGLLASLISAGRATGSRPLLGQAELMRLVKSQQVFLSASGKPVVDRIAA